MFFPLTDQVIFRHLSRSEPGQREQHAGLYPMLPDDTTHLLACDFDDKDWQGDAAAYVAACTDAGVPALAEVSRSGSGAHVWTFFTSPVSAGVARALGMALLRLTIDARDGMSLASYDRLFPAQDFLPTHSKGGARFGNLIALPLHGDSRTAGTTLFCDPFTWTPYEDQFAYLSRTERLAPGQVQELVNTLGPLQVGPSPTAPTLPARPRRSALGTAPKTVKAKAGAMLRIATTGLPPQLVAALKHAASFHNPEFYRRQNQRFSTFNTPRLICCFDATDPQWIALPRGLRDEAASLVAAAGGTLKVTNTFPAQAAIGARFTGELTAVQTRAVDAMAAHPTGVLVAQPGAGKTVMACALIAAHARPTAIIVNRAELLAQWRERLETFLDLGEHTVGSLGAGKDRRGGVVDLIMLQSLAHRDAPAGLLDGYGVIVVDECHAIGAPAAEAAIRKVKAKRWIGLSATPYRADQMDALITMQCGPIRHEIEDASTFAKHLVVHRCDFTTDEPGTDGASIQAIYGELAADQARNRQIAADIADAYRRGRCSLTLTNRIEHLHQLACELKEHGIDALLLHGGLPTTDRDRVRAELSGARTSPLALLAIDKVAGEGLDAPVLDTLFLASPISFKGRRFPGAPARSGSGHLCISADQMASPRRVTNATAVVQVIARQRNCGADDRRWRAELSARNARGRGHLEEVAPAVDLEPQRPPVRPPALSWAISSRLVPRAAARSSAASSSLSRRSALASSSATICRFRPSASSGVPSPACFQTSSPMASDSRFSSRRTRSARRLLRSSPLARSASSEALLTAGPTPGAVRGSAAAAWICARRSRC
ncbi:TOTE conflict system archaeo-eukaryotic primase domain-containing protein [Streptomyces xanthophaeus]|uniref:TOTE conflict system archaeo-eukaryotic primase domain-containing protein n=1 Tax=Streptomyces xanthophaeus TaxID=67385 RepID=UPI00398FD5A4